MTYDTVIVDSHVVHKNGIIEKCLELFQKEEIKTQIKDISKPICDNFMDNLLPQINLYLIIYLIILLIILILNFGIFLLLLKDRKYL